MGKCSPTSSSVGIHRMRNSLCVFLLEVMFRGPLRRMSSTLCGPKQVGRHSYRQTCQIDKPDTKCCFYLDAKDLTVPNLLLLSLWTPSLCWLLHGRIRHCEVSGRPVGAGTPLLGMTKSVGRLQGTKMWQRVNFWRWCCEIAICSRLKYMTHD